MKKAGKKFFFQKKKIRIIIVVSISFLISISMSDRKFRKLVDTATSTSVKIECEVITESVINRYASVVQDNKGEKVVIMQHEHHLFVGDKLLLEEFKDKEGKLFLALTEINNKKLPEKAYLQVFDYDYFLEMHRR